MANTDAPSRPLVAAVLDGLTEPVVLTDADGVVTCVNAVAEARVGGAKYLGVCLAEQAARREALRGDGTPLWPAEHPVSRVLATRHPVLGERLIVQPAGARATMYRVDTVPLWDGDRLIGTASVLIVIADVLSLVR